MQGYIIIFFIGLLIGGLVSVISVKLTQKRKICGDLLVDKDSLAIMIQFDDQKSILKVLDSADDVIFHIKYAEISSPQENQRSIWSKN